jgi:hypothetical protein
LKPLSFSDFYRHTFCTAPCAPRNTHATPKLPKLAESPRILALQNVMHKHIESAKYAKEAVLVAAMSILAYLH